MRLLICTQAVDLGDPVLGFFHRWLEEFAKRCEHVHVICLKKGDYALPGNVNVHSLGKEEGKSLPVYLFRFYYYIWSLRKEYDAVFVHMNPEYVILGGFSWRALGKKIVLWYSHRQRSWKLYAGLFFAHRVVTAAKESLTAQTRKADVIGHGIDATRFSSHSSKKIDRERPKIVAVGRITPIKNLEIAIETVQRLRAQGIQATLDLIGSPISGSDERYEAQLRQAAQKLDAAISFVGAVSNQEMSDVYPKYDFALNLCPTGGIDKAVLESMAAGIPTVVSNEAFRSYFGSYAQGLIVSYRDPEDVSAKVKALCANVDLEKMQSFLREMARTKADVSVVVSAIIERLYGR